jgi:hypothetical protein
MQTLTSPLVPHHFSTSQQLFIALVFVVLLLIVFVQSTAHKQRRQQRDTSLDQYIVNHYSRLLLSAVKYPFKRMQAKIRGK